MNAATEVAVATGFRSWFGIGPAPARLLFKLYSEAGNFVAVEELCAAAGIARVALTWHVCQLRQILIDEAIDTGPGSAYRLNEEGARECRAVLRQLGEEMLAAA
ncbi:MAG TPA: hypothetical protein VHZ26_09065 [Caulobacteraceae bacterium]|jgi:biotin operon repressor|nr:hypothetical protein [Caulobacteraceae bacterium]